MVRFSHQFVSLLVIINLVRTECVGTRADSLCLSQRSRSGTSIDETSSSSDTVCCRLCRSIIKDQEKQSNVTFKRCIQTCTQKKDIKDKDDQALSKLKERRIIEDNKKCLGLSDRSAASPHNAETKVEFQTISSDKYGYNVIWKPFPEFLFNHNKWTHYSLMYQFDNDPSPDGMMKCVLVPKNNTNWTLIYHSANFEPGLLRFTVVSFPFRGSSAGDNAINLSEFDPLRPTSIPTLILDTKGKQEPKAWAVTIIGGLLAGLVLIGVVLIVIIQRRSTLCPSYRQGATAQRMSLSVLTWPRLSTSSGEKDITSS